MSGFFLMPAIECTPAFLKVALFAQEIVHQGRPDKTGVDGVHPDFVRSINRVKIYNAAAARLSHGLDGMFGAKEHTFDIDGLNLVPFLFRDLVGWFVCAGNPCVVQHYIQMPEFFDYSSNGFPRFLNEH